jgi:phenylacetate-CoA ligase
MYGPLFRHVLFPFYETVLRGRPTLRHLALLEQQQWLPREEIERIRWRKLQALLRHTYDQVPYYRRRWDEIGARPEEIGGPADFARLPLLTKARVRAHAAELEAADYRGRNTLHSGTGGSTGESLRFRYARDSYAWRVASAARSDRWAGWDWGCKEAYVWGLPLVAGPPLQRFKKAAHHALIRRRIFNSYEFSAQTLPRFAARLAAYRPEFIVAYANPLYVLARFALEHGIRLPTPRGVIATAEMVYDHQKKVIEQAFGCKVFNRYGCREVMLIAAECACREGLHLNADNLYVEFLAEDGSPCGPGETGRIVLTDLHNYGMPFIRYEVGDLGTPTDRACSCGRPLPLMEMVAGRTMDVIQLPCGRYLTGLFFTHMLLMGEYPGLEAFQFEQTAPAKIVARFVRGPGWRDDNVPRMHQIVRGKLADDVDLSFEFVDKIPLTASGKWRPVIGLPPELVHAGAK